MPTDKELGALLAKARVIAVVGAKDDMGESVDGVGRYLIQAGYTVVPVHPKRPHVWGLPAYKSLADIPQRVDIVDVFRKEEFCPEHAREAAALEHAPAVFWMQLGIASAEAAEIAGACGCAVVENRCLMVEHRRLSMLGLLPERDEA